MNAPKLMPLMLQLYDSKHLFSQHIYYFWAKESNLLGNNAVLVWLDS